MAYERDELTTDISPHFLDVRFTHVSFRGHGDYILGTTLSTSDSNTRRRVLAPVVLLERAKDFAEAADALVRVEDAAAEARKVLDSTERFRLALEGSKHLLVIQFLYARSIELALKAFLSCHEKSEQELKSKALGHDLTACLGEAERLGLARQFDLTRTHRLVIHWISEPYAGKDLEYTKVVSGGSRMTEVPDVTLVRRVARSFIVGLREVCLRSTIILGPESRRTW